MRYAHSTPLPSYLIPHNSYLPPPPEGRQRERHRQRPGWEARFRGKLQRPFIGTTRKKMLTRPPARLVSATLPLALVPMNAAVR